MVSVDLVPSRRTELDWAFRGGLAYLFIFIASFVLIDFPYEWGLELSEMPEWSPTQWLIGIPAWALYLARAAVLFPLGFLGLLANSVLLCVLGAMVDGVLAGLLFGKIREHRSHKAV